MPERDATKVLLVDDHPVVRQGLAGLLQDEGFEVVGAAADLLEALAVLERAPTHVAIVDLTLESGSGLDVVTGVLRRHPDVVAMIYSVHEDGDHVRRAFAAGAMGFVTKREDPEVLVEGLRQVRRGERFLSPRASRAMADALAAGLPVLPDDALSPQELQVFGWVGRGLSAQEIAARMGLSVRTVETYFSRIQAKLNLAGRRELRQHATDWVRHAL
jgi:DNA-binding NarL/FixJ family response regulator